MIRTALRRLAPAVATLAVLAGGALSLAPAASASGPSCPSTPFCGTWQDTSNGQFLSVVSQTQVRSSATTHFAPVIGTATSTSFLMTHPADYAADNGALVQFSNGGRIQSGHYVGCLPGGGGLFLTNTKSPANGSTDWIFDGTGFTCQGNFLDMHPTGGVVGAAVTTPNAADESPIAFIQSS